MYDFNKNAHYFVQLGSCTDYGFISMVNVEDTHWVECKLEPYDSIKQVKIKRTFQLCKFFKNFTP